MKTDWLPARREDVVRVAQRAQPEQIGQLDQPFDVSDEVLKIQFRILWIDEEPEAFFGVFWVWKGFGRGAGLLTPTALSRAKLTLTRHVREGIEAAFEYMQLRRLEITVDARHQAAFDWAKDSLGFTPEHLMRQYGPDGADHWLFSMLRG